MLLKHLANENVATGPSRSTSAHKAAAEQKSGVAGRLQSPQEASLSSSFTVTFTDGDNTLTAEGRSYDGSDESITSAQVAENSFHNGIAKIKEIAPVSLQVVLKKCSDAEASTFSRSWTPPRTILHLSVVTLEILNVTYHVADAYLAVESLLIELPVLQHLGIDTKTLLEERRDILDGADCSTIRATTSGYLGGRFSWLKG